MAKTPLRILKKVWRKRAFDLACRRAATMPRSTPPSGENHRPIGTLSQWDDSLRTIRDTRKHTLFARGKLKGRDRGSAADCWVAHLLRAIRPALIKISRQLLQALQPIKARQRTISPPSTTPRGAFLASSPWNLSGRPAAQAPRGCGAAVVSLPELATSPQIPLRAIGCG